ncbi:hypothetical protein SAMN05216548_101277 [Faunimonas pinastri]|uniref:PPC domain-containing protein n=1 Tax=Faunimonas pinastri TaxID=1855383 RepID=A0A1H8ZYZ6_9HYPH|nr:PPC domain-containing DNA-binding protein [Faunimonas pinastri]SEP69473.1 hypothetical protein SAMN05216548_101277 [Faunimonas pinastri]
MKSKQLATSGDRAFVLVLDSGDEVLQSIKAFARDNRILAGRFTGLGAFSSVVLGFYDFETKDYHRIPIDEQVEVASFVDNIATTDEEVSIHPHMVVAKRDGSAFGGHVLEGRVHPTLEVLIEDAPAHLRRVRDKETGLPMLKV